MEQRELQKTAEEKWDLYRSAGRQEKLDMIRHSFSVYIPRSDEAYEFLHFSLDGGEEISYDVLKAAASDVEHRMRGFVRLLFSLGEDETASFTWYTARGESEWILSRKDPVLYVGIPEMADGFFIRYLVFRDACREAYERCYGWGYRSDVSRIEVPATCVDFMRSLDLQEEFELVRILDDGRSFETTDADWLLRYLDEHRRMEQEEGAESDRLRSYLELSEAIGHYLTKNRPMLRKKKLRAGTGISFSYLKDNWEECSFTYDLSMYHDDPHRDIYRRYGDLPDGRHFGVYIWPKNEAFPPESAMMIVGRDGEMQVNALIDGRWDVNDAERWPEAAAASPSGKCIAWLKDGEISVWHEDEKEKRFVSDDNFSLKSRIDDRNVLDAYMREDGILVLDTEDSAGKVFAYLCDEDIVLIRHEDCWIPAGDSEKPYREQVHYWPDSFAVMISSEDEEYEYYSCGVRNVRFEPGLEVIKPGMMADNPGLLSVTIPASVREVKTWAFGECTKLSDLVIEGDPSRVADWAEDAFQGCPCEEYYFRLRNGVQL